MSEQGKNTLLQSRVIKTEPTHWRQLQFLQDENFKDLSAAAREKLKASMLSNDFSQPFYVWHEEASGITYCLDGKHRSLILEELIEEGHEVPELLPATYMRCPDKQDAAKLVLQYSSIYARITEEGLTDFLEAFDLNLDDVKFNVDFPEFDMMSFEASMHLSNGDQEAIVPRSLTERFIVPPFSVLDTRQGYWQERKRAWHSLGIDSQETREDVELVARSGQSSAVYELRNKMRAAIGREPTWDEIIDEAKRRGMHLYEGASIFDPVLCEVLYTWFCPEHAVILDPFAGGSVRGIVAAKCGHCYHGIDLRPEQVEANRRQAEAMQISECEWYAGDSLDMDTLLPEGLQADFVFSCPPYHDLEQYSDDPKDLSNMDYDSFTEVYWNIIGKAMGRLKPNRFACFVVADIRDEHGMYRHFVSETIKAFTQTSSAGLYNEIILINVAGSMPIRVGRQFEGGRKVGKMHQNVLVFYKGDPKLIKSQYPHIDLSSLISPQSQPNIALTQTQGNEQPTTAIPTVSEEL